MHETERSEPVAPAVGIPVERNVGRLWPKRFAAALLHWWRMAGTGRRWRVRYPACEQLPTGGVSIPMTYECAKSYADVFGGMVERHEAPNV